MKQKSHLDQISVDVENFLTALATHEQTTIFMHQINNTKEYIISSKQVNIRNTWNNILLVWL